jgi:enoyl-CoA hydratase/carnithine racemase
MSYGTLAVERRGVVAVICLNRPEQLNAFTREMGEELMAAFRAAARDDEVRAIVLTGSGRAFCAGTDRDNWSCAAAPRDLHRDEEDFTRNFAAELTALPKLTIAALNGCAVGMGVTLSLCLDLRIAVRGAQLCLSFFPNGAPASLESAVLLSRVLGVSVAKRLLLCERTITAEQALDFGLLDEVCPAYALISRAVTLGTQSASYSHQTVAAVKSCLNDIASNRTSTSLALGRFAAHLL